MDSLFVILYIFLLTPEQNYINYWLMNEIEFAFKRYL